MMMFGAPRERNNHGNRVYDAAPCVDRIITGGNLMDEQIRLVLEKHGRLPVTVSALEEDADLYQAGLTSHASVNLMLALEDSFDVEFPQSMLRKRTFSSISSIRDALSELLLTAS